MAIPGFFRQTKPRGFNYVPRHYDPQKEEWEQKRMAKSMEQGEESSEHRAKGTETEERGERSSEHRAKGTETEERVERSSEHRAKGTETEERVERSAEHGAQSTEHRAQSAENKPYRSKIMRGSMKNYFPHTRERMQKQSMIRFIVILIIIVFVIYIYLRY